MFEVYESKRKKKSNLWSFFLKNSFGKNEFSLGEVFCRKWVVVNTEMLF